MLAVDYAYGAPTQAELFDIEERISRGTMTAEDGRKLLISLSQTREELELAESERDSAQEEARDFERDADELRDKLRDLEDGDATKGPDKADLAEALEIWKARAEAAEAKLSRRANKKAGA